MVVRTQCCCVHMSNIQSSWTPWVWAALMLLWMCLAQGMSESQIRDLREETEHMFYHGFDNYMEHAFPEDELRPVSCKPLFREHEGSANTELNDVLGNYTLTLIDSLSTLAILSSSPGDSGKRAWRNFQNGVRDFVRLYGDGSGGPAGQGERGRGFDVDSKVQVFETVIRVLGGLLSAHLFSVGSLPIAGYRPPEAETVFASTWDKSQFGKYRHGIQWENGFVYDGQLLRLAVDLADRLLPAFYTDTGLPYPRVNLRHGVPFYTNSPLNTATSCKGLGHTCKKHRSSAETTETCSAGAGSLVLELTVLSRLVGDGRYEELGKRAFWAVWDRRTDIGLIGSGIDAETGNWVHPYTGIGAGVDSFFEYAFKSFILLSSGESPPHNKSSSWRALDNHYQPLKTYEHSPEAFLQAWQDSHASIKHHLYRGEGYQHPHLVQGDVFTGATRAAWIDSLSAFYPGLLTLAGELDEAIEIHLLTTALWTRFSGLPERWNVVTGDIENGLTWYSGRPEFIESTYYLYRATKDPWYLHVGEMALRDIRRRCWTECGWAGLKDVRNGDLNDRMESFFLGETTKYLFLLYYSEHPLNKVDKPFVFSTEGHPLIIPDSTTGNFRHESLAKKSTTSLICQLAPPSLALGVSPTAGRPDLFHAASLARLHLMPKREVEDAGMERAKDHLDFSVSDLSSPSNYTFFPWTLPSELVPSNATSSPMTTRPTLDISFPLIPGLAMGAASLERIKNGIFVKAIGGLRLSMVQDTLRQAIKANKGEGFRVQVVNSVPLGKDEKVYLSREMTFDMLDPADPNFTRVRDLAMTDLVIDIVRQHLKTRNNSDGRSAQKSTPSDHDATTAPSAMKTVFSSLMNSVSSLLRDEVTDSDRLSTLRLVLPASISAGLGAGPLPDIEDAPTTPISSDSTITRLPWSSIYFADEICEHNVPWEVVKNHQILVIKRGGCSFSEKLRNIAAYPPSEKALKLVIVVSYDEAETVSASDSPKAMLPLAARRAEPYLVRPHLDEAQISAGGVRRRHLIPLVMTGGGDETYELLREAVGVGIKRRYTVHTQGVPINNLYIV